MFNNFSSRFSGIRPEIEKNDLSEEGDVPTRYKCSVCPDQMPGYTSETELEVHREKSHELIIKVPLPASWKDSLCLICRKKFSTREKYRAHLLTAHLYTDKNSRRVQRELFACNICEKIFFNKDLLECHIINGHNFKNRKSKCPHCKKLFCKSSLWSHFECRGMNSVGTCPFCLKKLKNRKALLEHTKSHRSYFKCETCNYIATKKEYFENHLEVKHPVGKQATNTSAMEFQHSFLGNKIHTGRKVRVQLVPYGLNLHAMLKICVLCREICWSLEEAMAHLESSHKTEMECHVLIKMCTCKEIFPSLILLKHHIFKNKDDEFKHAIMQS